MKQLKTLLFAAILFIGATSFVNAQSKVAHINVQELIESMPAYKEAQKQLDQMAETYDAQIKELATALKTKMDQYKAEANTQTDEENQNRMKELSGLEQNIRQYQANAQQDMQKKNIELLKPITEDAKAAILKVARAQGFDYVLDSTQGGDVIMADGKDLTTDVRKELGF